MIKGKIGFLALLLACTAPGPIEPPPGHTPASVSLKAVMQDSMIGAFGWHADSIHIQFQDSTLMALPGQRSRCVVWSDSPDSQPLRYVLYGSDSLGAKDSSWAIGRFPTKYGRHAWAVVEEYYGRGKGIYATIYYVNRECGDTAG